MARPALAEHGVAACGVALDGVVLDVPDTRSTTKPLAMAARPQSSGPFPGGHLVGVTECAPRHRRRCTGPVATGEQTLAAQLISRFYSYQPDGRRQRLGQRCCGGFGQLLLPVLHNPPQATLVWSSSTSSKTA